VTALTVVVATSGALAPLRSTLAALEAQTLDRDAYEVLVVDDGSTDGTQRWCAGWRDDRRRYVRQHRSGTPLARDLGVLMASSPLVLLLDDDERARPELIEEHLVAHGAHPEWESVVVGSSAWSTDGGPTALVHYLSRADPLPFSYPDTPRSFEPPVTHFRTRQLSAVRSFLARRGLHGEAFDVLADVELGCRLVRHGLRLRYWSHARSERLGTPTFDEWCEQLRREGAAAAAIARVHDHHDVRTRTRVDASVAEWHAAQRAYDDACRRARALEAAIGDVSVHDDDELLDLWRAYWRCFSLSRARGVAEERERRPA
jgi:glycosyltransferase involved in cell wall biosynthesis